MGTGAAGAGARGPCLTAAFLLYNAHGEVPGLVAGLLRQRRSGFTRQADWLEAVFVDDASSDGTADAVTTALAAAGAPAHCRLSVHANNLGLAATLNELFEEVRTPFLLTCHLDCRFGSDEYVAAMLARIEAQPRAAAVTGQPRLPPAARLPFAEKVNVVANLMDILTDRRAAELVPVGFAEGRCDVFRVDAVRQVGLYDTRLRVSGEDQVLAAKLRAVGYELYQAPDLEYHLSVSAEQNSVSKLLRHQRLFGRTTPYIVLAVPGTLAGLVGKHAGSNRTGRTLLRATQLASTAAYALVAFLLVSGRPAWLWGSALAAVVALKTLLFARHAQAVRFSARQLCGFALLQPAFDLAFTAGVMEGLVQLARARSRPID